MTSCVPNSATDRSTSVVKFDKSILAPTRGRRREKVAVGVLALQGSFHEHLAALGKLGVKGVLVRKPEQLEGISGLIIPGGESTTIARLAEYHNFIQALREFSNKGKSIWGTCAGLIFLANKAVGQKEGGQELIGGLDCTVHRNFFGSQLNSFETELPVPELVAKEGGPKTFRAIFIRAPAILEAGPSVEILADYNLPSKEPKKTCSDSENEAKSQGERVIIAVKQGHLLATAFHPELTSDTRWHSYFLKMVCDTEHQTSACIGSKEDPDKSQHSPQQRDLPIFQQTEGLSFEF
ncbi:probable pyridoxal 5'-phosphate synthase subunit PDX2 [Cryptomeria japonica]|uniref:probable pyridoxal 5'-phosphate synthase subunit PDX2 n=1 Tax=Cryptomeria japonica TaxID=3369 RepID=UPI0027DA5297|nr:probable pyridoxal 5'-phosphate synthase subunit PDX2 [Cryptomeria japonica]